MNLRRQGETDAQNKRIAVMGTFDGVHRGHRFLIDFMLSQAIKRGLEPSVITFAQHPLTVIRPQSAPPQLSTTQERMTMLAQCGIDTCIMLDFDETLRQMSARQFLAAMHSGYGITALVAGFNTRFGRDCVDGIEQYREIGGEIGIEVIQAPEYGNGISSSTIRRLISSGNISDANNALGYNYNITGTVVKGKQLGRTIGFPTANIEAFDKNKLIPATGVYAADITLPDSTTPHRAMLNIGRRPTVDRPGAHMTIEAHIIDFSGNLYGKKLRVELLRHLRPEQQFPSLQALTAQLLLDRRLALET